MLRIFQHFTSKINRPPVSTVVIDKNIDRDKKNTYRNKNTQIEIKTHTEIKTDG